MLAHGAQNLEQILGKATEIGTAQPRFQGLAGNRVPLRWKNLHSVEAARCELARSERMSFLRTIVRHNPKGDTGAYSSAPSPN
jgi:hypothetical protein